MVVPTSFKVKQQYKQIKKDPTASILSILLLPTISVSSLSLHPVLAKTLRLHVNKKNK